jgi:cysteine desulfurase
MLANNESGVIQPIAEAADIIKSIAPACIVHTDATQAVGKIPIELNKHLRNIDLLSLSAHKFHGPKGLGALFIRAGTPIQPWIYGGGQQNGMRSGTENPALAAGTAKAAILAAKLANEYMANIQAMRDMFERSILLKCPHIRLLGAESPRLANTSLVILPEQDGEMLVHALLAKGIVVSTGSACSSGTDQPSHVITAMDEPFHLARNVLRVSLSRYTTFEDVTYAAVCISEMCAAT